VRHGLSILFVVLLFACSGGGCSSGCSSCGMTPLTRPIATANLIDNAGSLRLTRSGLDFLQSSAPVLAGSLIGSGSGGEFQYPITLAPDTLDGITISFCPSGPNETSTPEECTLQVELSRATFYIDSVTPNAIMVSGTIPILLSDLPLSGSYTVSVLGISKTLTITLHVGVGSNGSCCEGSSCAGGTTDGQPIESYYDMPFSITLPLVADTIAPRVGFTKIDAANVAVNVGVSASDLEVCFDCDFSVLGVDVNLDSVCDGLTNGIIGLVFPLVQSTLESEIQKLVQGELCTKPAAGVCPAGSSVDTGTGNCDYDVQPGTCLPIGLGLEGGLNLGADLQSISYGAMSNLDLALAAGGTMIPANAPTAPAGSPADGTVAADPNHTPNGVTLGLLGALVPDPFSQCVPQAANPIPTGIPIPVELEENTVTPWASTDPPGPQLGVALAARYLNYALGSIYNSGALCLGVSTDSFAELNTGYLSLLAPSMKDLTFERDSAAAAVVTRPQNPPTVVVGNGTDPNTDPTLMVSIKQFALDFYVFSDSRFVRIFTYTADLTIPVTLSTAVTAANPDGELAPTLGTVTAMNGAVTNSELLLEKPTAIAGGLNGLIGSVVSQVAGSISPISLASLTASLGISFTIPADGIRKLTSGTDDFLAIFGNLALAPAGAIKVRPTATLTSQEVHPEAMALDNYDAAKLPTLHLTFGTEPGSGSGGAVEYTYWIDQGTRSLWSTETDVSIQNQSLYMQGHHILNVSAREVGSPYSESLTPVQVPFLIDVIPPTMTLDLTPTGASLTAWDYVSDADHLVARTRVTDAAGNTQPWSEWQPLSAFANMPAPGSSSSVGAEVRDEAGNVATNEVALIRGQDDVPAAAGACGCSTPGTNTQLGARGSALLLLTGLGLLFGLRRVRRTSGRAASAPLEPRRRPVRSRRPHSAQPRRIAAATALGVSVVVGALSQGCSCGSNGGTVLDGSVPDSDTGATDRPDGGRPGTDGSMTGCGSDCNQPCLPALPTGIVGAYTSIAKDLTGAIWVAGYDDSAVAQAFSGLYGDLVVGKYDSAKNQVAWATVDGLPPSIKGTCPIYDPTGWRGGISDPGPDVGLWTSIQLDANDHPIVSYYDSTNSALKFASSSNGTTWTSYTVMQAANSDIGRYSKMLVVDGKPVIAFLIMEPGNNGKMRSRVELGTGKVATPASASDWTFEDAAVDDDGPCRLQFCPSPNVCIAETGECAAPSTGCSSGADGGAACASPAVCVGGSDAGPACGTPLASTYIDIYPNAFGDYITMAPTSGTSNGVGIVVYDRIHGALVQLAKLSGTWTETVLDSETGARAPNPGPDGGITPAETGDVGVGASLFITPGGNWHVSYVNGTTEALQYIEVPGGTGQPAAPEIVDNGYTLSGTAYTDGLHIVGDDSSIQVDVSGNVTISFQDATAGVLLVATGMPETGNVHTWEVLAASQPNKFAGYFSHSLTGVTSSFANFWRTADQTTGDETGNVTFVSP
jgi:hypothetical protein